MGRSSGKTTLAQHVIAEVQKLGGLAAFIDAEHALDPEYAKKIGININDMLISQPDNGEQALEIVETLVRSNAVDVIVIDSVAALTPKAEIEGGHGRLAHGTAGATHEPGAPKTHRDHFENKNDRHLHQSDATEDRGYFGKSRNHDRRDGAEVLRIGPYRDPERPRKSNRAIASSATA